MKFNRIATLFVLAGLCGLLSAPAAAQTDSAGGTLEQDPELLGLMDRIEADPDNPCLHNELGIALSSRAYFDEAQASFREAIARDAENPSVHFNAGTLYLKTGQPRKALSPLKQALRLDPNFAMAWYNLGAAHDALENFDGAVESYTRALELDPSLRDASVNPSIVNNRYLLPVQTRIYRRTIGTLGTPLRSTCTPGMTNGMGDMDEMVDEVEPEDEELVEAGSFGG